MIVLVIVVPLVLLFDAMFVSIMIYEAFNNDGA